MPDLELNYRGRGMPLQAIPVRRGVSRIIVGTCQLIVRQERPNPSTWSKPPMVRQIFPIIWDTRCEGCIPDYWATAVCLFSRREENPPYRKRPIAWHPVNPQILKILIQTTLTQKPGIRALRGPAAHQYKSVVQCPSCRHPAEPDPVALPSRLPAATASVNANTTFPFV